MVGVELVADRRSKAPDASRAAALQDHLLGDGFVVGLGGFYGNVLRLQPPLVIDEEDLDRAVDALDRALSRAS
jgi:4-aminobutyrate aminotransferase-like enzyme